MRSAIVSALVLVAVSSFPAAWSAELGSEWISLDEQETRIVFDAPALKNSTKRFLKRGAEGRSAAIEFGQWTSSRSKHPVARVYIWEARPGFHFKSDINVSTSITKWGPGGPREPEWGERGRARTGIGFVRYQMFLGPSATCVGFGLDWAPPGGSFYSAGTKRLFGYYCDPGLGLTAEAAEAALAGFDLQARGSGVRAQEPKPGECAPLAEADLKESALADAISAYYDAFPVNTLSTHPSPTYMVKVKRIVRFEDEAELTRLKVTYKWSVKDASYIRHTSDGAVVAGKCGDRYWVKSFE